MAGLQGQGEAELGTCMGLSVTRQKLWGSSGPFFRASFQAYHIAHLRTR